MKEIKLKVSPEVMKRLSSATVARGLSGVGGTILDECMLKILEALQAGDEECLFQLRDEIPSGDPENS